MPVWSGSYLGCSTGQILRQVGLNPLALLWGILFTFYVTKFPTNPNYPIDFKRNSSGRTWWNKHLYVIWYIYKTWPPIVARHWIIIKIGCHLVIILIKVTKVKWKLPPPQALNNKANMIFDAHTVDIEISAGEENYWDDFELYTLLYSTNLSYIHNCVKLKSTLKSTKIKSDWGRGRNESLSIV